MVRVLIVEDQANIRLLMRVVLRKLGYEVFEARSGPEALAVLSETDRIAAIVTDLSMPDTDTDAYLDAIKESYPQVPIIITSAYTTADWAAQSLNKGMTYLQKPFTWDDLATSIRAATSDISHTPY